MQLRLEEAANMNLENKVLRFLITCVVILLQLIMTQVFTLVASFFLPGMENFPETHPVPFVVLVGITFTMGVFLTGWLALRFHWLKGQLRSRARLAGTVLGAYLPLLAAILWFSPLTAGHPGFLISALAAIVGFYLPEWLN